MTPKQADFVRWYFELGNASEAYKRAYNSHAKPNTLHRKANDLLKHPVIKAEVQTMQEQARERNQVTIDNVVDELEEARQVAKQSGNAAAMVSATLGKAKVLGLVVDKQETNTKILTPPVFNFVGVQPLSQYSQEELRAAIKELQEEY
ncbi:terminase small subunit [uncultured Agitococcus sp.]|uniref:terminase small subunit n=1 Tax=uncultured Agitococcus sp. TaxID=1506599 RepID=UPI002607C6AB|nr:terminase small subunit [uncultured Agitococcus sp.]